MYHPQLKPLNTSRQTVDVFRGYNHNLRIGEGEFYSMTNMTSDHYPVLSPRRARGLYRETASPQGFISKDALCYVDGADLVLGEERIAMNLSTRAEDCPKELTSMGAYLIILPDKKYLNTATREFGDIEAVNTSTGNVELSLCTADGEDFAPAVSPTAPANPENLDYWIDTSAEPHSLKQYAEANAQWVTIATTYVRLRSDGIGRGLRELDGVTISGIVAAGAEGLNGAQVLHRATEDELIITGLLSKVVTQTVDLGAVTVARTMPNMDFVIESENRLWGCRYGLAANGEFVNEIYASALGDFRNWSRYLGISTDSYAASCGTDGPFTGAITHLGYPLFFKENCLHKVYGSYPASYQIQTTACRGVQKGCHRSLAIVNETLFYKARGCICAYDGSLPAECSQDLGTTVYSDAVGGAHGSKYYISMRSSTGWHLFTFDAAKGLWHREDNLHVSRFCSHGGELYAIDEGSRNIITLLGTGEPFEGRVNWEVETGDLGTDLPDRKCLNRITLRLKAERGTQMQVFAMYDRSGEWELLCDIRATELRSFSVPIRAKRCDTLRLKITGTGGAYIYGYTKTMTQGSELS